jgi:hypothetical protein
MCQNTRYLVTSKPVATYACHCTDCQTRTGSAFGLSMIISTDDVKLTHGVTETWTRVVQGGQKFLWERCPNFGTNLMATIEGAPEITAIWPGTLDDSSWVEPKAHLWTKSAQRWVMFRDSDVVYDEQPDDFSVLFGL